MNSIEHNLQTSITTITTIEITSNMESHSFSFISIKSTLIFILLTILASSKFQSITIKNLFSNFSAWDIAGNHMVVVKSLSNSDISFHNFITNKTTGIKTSQTGITKIITHQSNTENNYCFVLMNLLQMKWRSKTTTLCVDKAFLNITLVTKLTTGFGNNQGELYSTESLLGSTLLKWARGQSNFSMSYTAGYIAKSQIFYNNSIFYAFLLDGTTTSRLSIFQAENPGQPTLFNNFQYPNCPSMTLDAYNAYLVVNCGGYAQVRNSYPPYIQIRNITLVNSSETVAIVANNSFVAKSNRSICQYSIVNGEVMDYQEYGIAYPNQMRRVGPNLVYLFTNQQLGLLYNISDVFVCQIANCSCGQNYILQGTICIAVVPPVPVNATDIEQNVTAVQPNLFSQKLRYASQILGNSLAIMSVRFIMKSNIPLSLFLQQFYLYKYYNNVYYPQTMVIFMQEIEVINLLKAKPDFMDFMSYNFSIRQSFLYQNLYTNEDNGYFPFYFTQSIKQFYSSTIILNAFIFFVLKITAKFVSIMKKVSIFSCFRVLCDSLQQKSQVWALFMTIVQSEFLIVSFHCLNQINLSFFYSFQNKTNLLGSICLFFIWVIYGVIGYPIMNKYCRKFSVKLLVFSKYNIKSLWLQNSMMFSLKLMKSFAHSIIISTAQYKFSLLLAADCVIVCNVLYFKKLFYNRTHFNVYLSYQVGVLLVDTLLLLKQGLLSQNFIQINYFLEYIMLTLLVLTVIKFIISVYRSMYQIYKFLSKNKVSPEVIQKKEPSKRQKSRVKTLNVVQKIQKNSGQIQDSKNDTNSIYRHSISKFNEANKNTNQIILKNRINLLVRVKTIKKDKVLKNISKFAQQEINDR